MKTVIELAMEAGVAVPAVYSPDLERFAELVRADEREACAKVCADLWCKEPEPGDARDCHDAIRARGQV